MGNIKTIGVLTSGGDAPGMNAAVRAVVRTALFNGLKVKGIYKGFEGLLEENIETLEEKSVSNILSRGGTVLFSARCEEFREMKNVKKAAEIAKKAGIDGLVVIGGDGSLRGAKDLASVGLPCIGVPGTIDNDLAATDYTVGFDTAVNTVVENVDRLRDTTQSHDRCSVVEVMGRNCGDIALHSAICTGAVSVLIPELDFTIDGDVIAPMVRTLRAGKNHFIVLAAEGVNKKNFGDDETLSATNLAKYIQDKTGVESRATVLGHIQRGGIPTAKDRVLGSQFGNYAVHLLMEGHTSRIVVLRNNKLEHVDLEEGLAMTKTLDMDLVRTAREVSL